MSLAVEALADEVYATHAALSRAGGTSTRHPFGEVVVNAAFPDIQMVNCILHLQAPDWSVARLEEAAALPLSRHVHLSTRDHQTYEELGPRLVQAGYRPEHQLIMVQLAEPTVAPNPGVDLVRVESDSVWEDFNGLVRLGCAEQVSSWPPAAVEQLLALKRWRGICPSSGTSRMKDGNPLDASGSISSAVWAGCVTCSPDPTRGSAASRAP